MNPWASVALGSAGLLALSGCQGTGAPVVTPRSSVAPDSDAAPPASVMPEADAGTPSAPGDAASSVDTPPQATPPDMSAAPAYPASALYETFSGASARAKLIACYTPGKQRDPQLRGKVIVKFTIQTSGSAKPVANEGSNLPDDDVIACVVRVVKTLHFQKPVEGSVTVVYPLIFHSSGDEILVLPNAGKK